ncbi:hypothetical protein D3C84_193890 [compost metagenome]
MATDLQQRQHQRGEFVTHGNAGKTQADIRCGAIERERRRTTVAAIGLEGDLVGQADNLLQQAEQFAGFVAVIEGRDYLERLGDLLEVGLQLGLQIGVQHGGKSSMTKIRGNKMPGRITPGHRALEGPVMALTAQQQFAKRI